MDGVVRTIARRHRLPADEADELGSSVRLKLVENDYEVLRKFEGRSQLRTYLITVVQRMFLDERNAHWGKWRPSAQACRLGPVGMLLDQLTTRDNLSFEEAVQSIAARHGDTVSRAQLEAMYAQLPARTGRRFVGDDALERMPAPSSGGEALLEAADQGKSGDRIERALAAVLDQLDAEDRVILRMRFCQNMNLARIAELLAQAPKPFYRRMDRLFATLREALQAHGVSEADVAAVVGNPLVGIDGMLGRMVEKTGERPSVP